MIEPPRDRIAVTVFAVVGGLMGAYLVWLVLDAPQSLQSGWFNGWVGNAFRLAAAMICLTSGLRRRRGSLVPLVFGVALIFTTIGNVVLTIDSIHGPPPPPPTPADFFGLGTIVLCFVGIGLMAGEDRERLSPHDLLDGGVAALGAAALCAAFAFAHLPQGPGQSKLGTAFLLAYPIGYVILVFVVVGAVVVTGRRSRMPWLLLTAAFALLALGSALSSVVGQTEVVRVVNEIQWPAATILIAASMWVDPGDPDPLTARKGIAVWIPALACAAAIVVLFAATLKLVNHAATALAATALVLVMVRTYSELRQEIAIRQRTEKDLRVRESEFRNVAEEQSALRRIATLVARGVTPDVVFMAVAEEVGRAVPDVDLALVGRYDPDGAIEYVGGWGKADHRPAFIGVRVPLGGQNVSTLVFDGHEPTRVDHLPDEPSPATSLARQWSRSSAGAPINVEGQLWGVMIVASWDQGRLPVGVENELAKFTDLVATAIGNAQARAELTAFARSSRR